MRLQNFYNKYVINPIKIIEKCQEDTLCKDVQKIMATIWQYMQKYNVVHWQWKRKVIKSKMIKRNETKSLLANVKMHTDKSWNLYRKYLKQDMNIMRPIYKLLKTTMLHSFCGHTMCCAFCC